MGDILFLAHRIPYPPDRGDKIRSFHLLQYLAARRRVHLVAFADDARDLAYAQALEGLTGERLIVQRTKSRGVAAIQALASGKPMSLTAFEDKRVRNGIKEILTKHDIETVFSFSGQMAQYLPYAGEARIVMDFVDVDSAKFAGYAGAAKGPMRWMMAREARLLAAFERKVAARADASLFVSEAEATLFRARSGAEHVFAIENGIDTAAFHPDAAFDPVAAAGPLIVFTGQMDYRPNIEAVRWFAEAILPLVHARHPEARFAIVGRNPADSVVALGKAPHIIVTGEVTDVRGWLATASVVVASLKLARGVQNKVLEAMAMARPVVASAAAAEGIDHAGTIRVAGDEQAFADAVSALIEDPAGAATLGAAGRARVRERYGWDARLAPLDAIMGFTPDAIATRSAA